jgi:hypothetical protein
VPSWGASRSLVAALPAAHGGGVRLDHELDRFVARQAAEEPSRLAQRLTREAPMARPGWRRSSTARPHARYGRHHGSDDLAHSIKAPMLALKA